MQAQLSEIKSHRDDLQHEVSLLKQEAYEFQSKYDKLHQRLQQESKLTRQQELELLQLKNTKQAFEKHNSQCNDFIITLFDFAYRCNDNVKPQPLTELPTFDHKVTFHFLFFIFLHCVIFFVCIVVFLG